MTGKKVEFIPEEELVKIYKNAERRKLTLVMRLIEEIHAYRAAISEIPEVLPESEKDQVVKKMREDMIKLQQNLIYMRTVLFLVADMCPECKGDHNLDTPDHMCSTCFNVGAVPKTAEDFEKAIEAREASKAKQKPSETEEAEIVEPEKTEPTAS